ncbi:MAG: helix-turn-helix domain-containing protein [Tannerellaceae bacterium]|nr:helix-turn-helix domain-containing protein [Tannerellaceae bacterium]
MREHTVVTTDTERVVSFFNSLDQMLNNIGNLTKNYRPMLVGERYLTDKEIAERLKLSRRVLQNYRTEGRIPYCQLGGKILYRESDIQKILDEGYKNDYR